MHINTSTYVVQLLILITPFGVGCCGTNSQGKLTTQDVNKPIPVESSSTTTPTVRLKPEQVETPALFSDGQFVDEQHAWINRIGYPIRTIDGGLTWQQMRPSDQTESRLNWMKYSYVRATFITPTRGWLTGHNSVWQTEDGGESWNQILSFPTTSPVFADSQHGWMDVLVNNNVSKSYITQDGGKTWKPCGDERSDQFSLGTSFFLTQDLGWAIMSSTTTVGSVDGVARTMNQGCSWQQIWRSTDNPDEQFSDIYFLNDREGWLAGKSPGSLYNTKDGGRTWEQLTLPSARTNVTSVYFVTSNEGWILTKRLGGDVEGIFHTVNGGETWLRVTRTEVLNSSSKNNVSNSIPLNWKAGRLFQMLSSST